MEWVPTITQKINKNQAKHWISHRSFIVPYNYKGKLIFSVGQSVSYRKTDKFSCFDNYIDFQCILFRQAFQTGLSTFLLFWGCFFLRSFSFSAYSLWEYLVVPKRTEILVFVGSLFTPWRWTVVEYFVPLVKLHMIW